MRPVLRARTRLPHGISGIKNDFPFMGKSLNIRRVPSSFKVLFIDYPYGADVGNFATKYNGRKINRESRWPISIVYQPNVLQ